MIDLNEDSKVEIVDTLFRRKVSYFAFEDAIGHCKPRKTGTTYESFSFLCLATPVISHGIVTTCHAVLVKVPSPDSLWLH